MKLKNVFRIILSVCFALIIIGVVSFVVVPNVLAATGCFPDTNGHWAETFICWLEENGISGGYPDGTFKPENNVTRAELAVMLQNTYDVTAPISGEIRINSGHTNWVQYEYDDDLKVNNYSNRSRVYKDSTGGLYIQLSPDIPTILYDRAIRLSEVIFCYETNGNMYIDNVWIRKNTGASTSTELLEDTINRTDNSCRTYTLTQRATVGQNSNLVLFVDLQYDGNSFSDNFGIGNTTWIFDATDVQITTTSPIENELNPDKAGVDGIAP